MGDKLVVILRGVAGSGKSRKTAELQSKTDGSCITVSTDFFWMQDGSYKFDPARLSEAHGNTLRVFIQLVQKGEIENIFVDNTNTSLSELAPYAAIAVAYGYKVKIITMIVNPAVAAARCVHGTPYEVIHRQACMLEHHTSLLPKWWEHEVLVETKEAA